jgi:copper chaperone CopZ
MNKLNIQTSGMHCRSCELMLEKAIKKLPNIEKVSANQKTGIVEVEFSTPLSTSGEGLGVRQQIESVILEN